MDRWVSAGTAFVAALSRVAGDHLGMDDKLHGEYKHGRCVVAGLTINNYGLALRDSQGDGFLGDRASQTAFRTLLDEVRSRVGFKKDPFGDRSSSDLEKKDIDRVLLGGPVEATHIVHVAIETYAVRLAEVVQAFLSDPSWHGVEAIVMGGGMPKSEFGRLAVRRARRLLKDANTPVKIKRLRQDPDDAALIGWAAMVPRDASKAHAAYLAVDVGGTNLRCGLMSHGLDKREDGSAATVLERMHWRHADDEPSRREAIDRLAGMLNGLIAQARTLRIDLAPFVGIAIPGRIEPDGGISTGAENLPGDWERPFDLPAELGKRLDPVGTEVVQVVLHNDAVVQGLSERRRMCKFKRWGVMTIGTGLGNACYTVQ